MKHRISPKQLNERTVLKTHSSSSQIDITVLNGKILHLAQCWSFQVKDVEKVLNEIKSWAWTMRDLRDNGGEIVSNRQQFNVPKDIGLSAVFARPSKESDAFGEAIATFKHKNVMASVVDVSSTSELDKLSASIPIAE